MKQKNFFIIFLVITLFLIIAPFKGESAGEKPKWCPEISLGKDWCPQNPADYFNKIYQISLAFGIILALAMIIYGGLLYATSRDNVSQQQNAREQIRQAIFGLIILFGAVLILRTINPDLVNLGKISQGLLPISPKDVTQYLKLKNENALSEECRELRKQRKDAGEYCRSKSPNSYMGCDREKAIVQMLIEKGCPID